jgi:sRNA-binding carbon storage regulator CsrA
MFVLTRRMSEGIVITLADGTVTVTIASISEEAGSVRFTVESTGEAPVIKQPPNNDSPPTYEWANPW